MLFFAPIILLGICVVVGCFINDYDFEEIITGITGISAICIVTILIMLTILVGCYVGVDGNIASLEAERETLVYQLENDMYDNDNDLGKKELMDDIKYWNSKIARRQANQEDFWIGIFIPDVYDQFELIELE